MKKMPYLQTGHRNGKVVWKNRHVHVSPHLTQVLDSEGLKEAGYKLYLDLFFKIEKNNKSQILALERDS